MVSIVVNAFALAAVGILLARSDKVRYESLRSELLGRMGRFEADLGTLRSEMTANLGTLGSEMTANLGTLRSEMTAMRSEMTASLGTMRSDISNIALAVGAKSKASGE